MRLERKKDVSGIKIHHNKKLFWIIIFLVLVMIGLLIGARLLSEKNKIVTPEMNLCVSDADCVPASCCHANSCVIKENAPVCEGIACTMDCKPETLDCGQASCKCDSGKCIVLSQNISIKK